jgi:glycosyltransferase involved in cell wall biosynthesis
LKSKKTKDLSYRIFKRKTNRYNGLKLNIVSPSNWLKECAEKSKLLQKKKIQVIPNSLDTNVFKPIQKNIARKNFNLPDDKKIILFGAMNSISNKKKGFIYLKKALESLSKRNTDFLLVVFGASHDKDIEKLPFEVKFLGTLYDEYTLSLAYSASDVFVAPSEEDNFPNTILESFSSGTSCVTFEIGGFPDMIDHKKNGYLAKPFDVEDLAKGIDFCLSNSKLGLNVRKKVEKEYSLEKQAKEYKRLYQLLLK